MISGCLLMTSVTSTYRGRKEGQKGLKRGSKHDVITVSRQQFKGHSLFADLHSFQTKVCLSQSGPTV